MRLLHTSNLNLQTFYDDSIPPYAILSHRWEAEEVTFQDLSSPDVSSLAGYSKLNGCCKRARSEGWEWAWIDTCCIDKTSSAELSEAINSMFTWYRDAGVCYAFLTDVPSGLTFEDHQETGSAFRLSKWFSRGWTLQELLAPKYLVFFDQGWEDIGSKLYLLNLVSKITGIGNEYLLNFTGACVAQKMSWAAKRETTRVEDRAYCMMGIFGIHMPPLYGKKEYAFTRLQLEILKIIDDDSIFAWCATGFDKRNFGALAPSPRSFINSSDVRTYLFDKSRPPMTVTSKGLQLDAFVHQSVLPNTENEALLLPLNCHIYPGQKPVALILEQINPGESLYTCWHETVLREADIKELPQLPPQRLYLKFIGTVLENPKIHDRHCQIFFETKSLSAYGLELWDTTFIKFPEADKDEITPKNKRLTMIPSRIYVLQFGGKGAPGFSVLLHTRNRFPRMRLIFLEGHAESDTIQSSLLIEPMLAFSSDRASILLQSGTAISAALRRSGETELNMWVMELTADTTGKLRWPELARSPEDGNRSDRLEKYKWLYPYIVKTENTKGDSSVTTLSTTLSTKIKRAPKEENDRRTFTL